MRLYNTLSRQLEELPPPDAGPVRMYFCGPTVYQRAHIGNARPFLLGMWLRDWLRHRGYGRLSGQRPDQVEEQEPNALKEDPRDFALWKANKPGEDTSWDSPWGRGRPGWHIECSVMAEVELGQDFELHGGGLDLVFPHHENELAQSRALGHDFAQIWAHNGMLRFTGAKMSKSEGNVVTIRDALEQWGRETLLVFFLTAHWSKPIDFSEETLAAAAARVEGFREVFRGPSESADEGEWERFEAALE